MLTSWQRKDEPKALTGFFFFQGYACKFPKVIHWLPPVYCTHFNIQSTFSSYIYAHSNKATQQKHNIITKAIQVKLAGITKVDNNSFDIIYNVYKYRNITAIISAKSADNTGRQSYNIPFVHQTSLGICIAIQQCQGIGRDQFMRSTMFRTVSKQIKNNHQKRLYTINRSPGSRCYWHN